MKTYKVIKKKFVKKIKKPKQIRDGKWHDLLICLKRGGCVENMTRNDFLLFIASARNQGFKMKQKQISKNKYDVYCLGKNKKTKTSK